jgi:uncharacterized lipoprotein YddW (UPF0748 family)
MLDDPLGHRPSLSKQLLATTLILFLSIYSLPGDVSAAKPIKARPKPAPKVIVTPSKVKMLWIDSEQDVFLTSSQQKVAQLLDKCAAAGINTIAVDVKPWSGYVLYNSRIAPKLRTFNGKPYPENYDLLRTVVAEGHKRGLSVHAAINIFSEGLKAEKEGPVFAHPDWECVVYDVMNYIRTDSGNEQLVGEINQRLNPNTLTIYDPDYGKRLFRKDDPGNVIDGNLNSPSSKWVSNSARQLHWIALEWPVSVKIDTLRMHFLKNYVIPQFRVQYQANNQWVNLTDVTDNKELDPTVSFLPINTRRIRILIDDPGIDSIARIREIEVFNTQGNPQPENIALQARAQADSMYTREFSGHYYVVKNNEVTAGAYREQDLDGGGLEIPATGYIINADGKLRNWALANLGNGTQISRGLRSRLVPETQYPGGTLVYVNPSNPEIQERALNIIDEIVKNYRVDGIILDRVRYDNFRVDFSDLSRKQFERFIGEPVRRWPEDIYQIVQTPNGTQQVEGRYYQEWIYWRASIIKDFMVAARQRIKDIRPSVQFGDYVGGWYPDYYEVGVNWASYKYDPSKDYDWATPGYRGNGYAEYLDYLCPGLYYPDLTIAEAQAAGKKDYASLEGGIRLLNKVVGNSTQVYSSLYYPNISKPERFIHAVQTSLAETDGVMIFSLYYFQNHNKWDLLKEALSRKTVSILSTQPSQPAIPPRTVAATPQQPQPKETFSLRSIFRIPVSWFSPNR